MRVNRKITSRISFFFSPENFSFHPRNTHFILSRFSWRCWGSLIVLERSLIIQSVRNTAGSTYLIQDLSKCLVICYNDRSVIIFQVLVHNTSSLSHPQPICRLLRSSFSQLKIAIARIMIHLPKIVQNNIIRTHAARIPTK